jgi:hypothetical protein
MEAESSTETPVNVWHFTWLDISEGSPTDLSKSLITNTLKIEITEMTT